MEFLGPRGKLELRPADWHLFIGDEAALPAIAALVEALPTHERAVVLAEVGDLSDCLTIPTSDISWLCRGGATPGSPQLLADALDNLITPPGLGRAYLLGESRAMTALRLHVQAHGISSDQMFVKGYWNLRPNGPMALS